MDLEEKHQRKLFSTKFMADKHEATYSLLCFQILPRTVVLASRDVKKTFREDYHISSFLAEKEGKRKRKTGGPPNSISFAIVLGEILPVFP
jgi:hypothetical protein